MIILSLDTSTPSPSVALTKNHTVLSQGFSPGRDSLSKNLLRMVDDCLKSAGLHLEDIDAFAAAKGPGSFTGLRLGISTVTGFSLGAGKPSLGIETLRAMALASTQRDHLICPLLDARKGEIYGAMFRFVDGNLIRVAEDVLEPAGDFLKRIEGKVFFLGHGSVHYKAEIESLLETRALFGPENPDMSVAAAVGFLALEDFKKRERGDIVIKPRYIRRCEAEIKREEKASSC
ncbi:MAG: tRNA (adenosine(37)-N6)-threonylcarbamoyltransferase complex dimerization subunit type 1 TsaB [Nitrospinae bacterium]|nr:tRNA (adenosine(37)-N6)-threonylcarbamoyltransferase complex dimerization subunit type 1 TsaB [Nitrospinota bacterium]